MRTDKIGAPAAWVWRGWGKYEKRARAASQNKQAVTTKGSEAKNRRSRVNLTCKREVGEMTAPEYTCSQEASLNRSRTPGGLARSPSIASPTPASWHNLSQLYSSLQVQNCWPDDRQSSSLPYAASWAEKGILVTVRSECFYILYISSYQRKQQDSKRHSRTHIMYRAWHLQDKKSEKGHAKTSA